MAQYQINVSSELLHQLFSGKTHDSAVASLFRIKQN